MAEYYNTYSPTYTLRERFRFPWLPLQRSSHNSKKLRKGKHHSHRPQLYHYDQASPYSFSSRASKKNYVSDPYYSSSKSGRPYIHSLPPELHLNILSTLDPVSSTCFGLSSRQFYPIHQENISRSQPKPHRSTNKDRNRYSSASYHQPQHVAPKVSLFETEDGLRGLPLAFRLREWMGEKLVLDPTSERMVDRERWERLGREDSNQDRERAKEKDRKDKARRARMRDLDAAMGKKTERETGRDAENGRERLERREKEMDRERERDLKRGRRALEKYTEERRKLRREKRERAERAEKKEEERKRKERDRMYRGYFGYGGRRK